MSTPHLPRPARILAGCAGGLLCALAPSARAAPAPTPSPRDELRRIIEPIVDAFARSPDGPNRAFTLRAHLVEASAQPPELRGSPVRLVCQAPDRLLFQFCALGTIVTVGRQGQTFWASPAERLAPLLAAVEEKPPTSDDKEPLAPLRLTIPMRLFWVLYYLVGVQDVTNPTQGPAAARGLDIHVPESKTGEFTRLWVSSPDAASPRPVRAEFFSPDSHAVLDLDEVRVSPSVRASSFEPDADQRGQALDIPAERFRPFLAQLMKAEEKRRTEYIHDHPLPSGAAGR